MHRKIGWICALLVLVLILCRGALAPLSADDFSKCPFWDRSCQPQQSPEKRDFETPSFRVRGVEPYDFCSDLKVLQSCIFGDCSKTYCEGNKICISPEQDKSGQLQQAECLEVEINNLECSGQDQIKQQYYNVQYGITVEWVEICPFEKPICDAGECVAKQVQQIVAGVGHTCALLGDQTVKCWGANNAGQLGDGTSMPGKSKTTPTAVANLGNVKQMTAGQAYTCALLGDQTVKCWGANWYGQLGDGTSVSGKSQSTPTAVANLGNVKQIVAGGGHACALLGDQTVKCWGANGYGQLGDGMSSKQTSTATSIVNLGNVKQITAGWGHTCALLDDQTVKCWGLNDYGQLGNDGKSKGITAIATPTPIVNLGNVKQITAGWGHTCALLDDQTVKCWGRNEFGQLGYGTLGPGQSESTPTPVANLGNVKQIAAGMEHTCALLGDQTVKCWGANGDSQLGNGTYSGPKLTPTLVSSLENVKQIAAGANHTCAMLNNQTDKCWGNNQYGQLGDGTQQAQYSPVKVKFP